MNTGPGLNQGSKRLADGFTILENPVSPGIKE